MTNFSLLGQKLWPTKNGVFADKATDRHVELHVAAYYRISRPNFSLWKEGEKNSGGEKPAR